MRAIYSASNEGKVVGLMILDRALDGVHPRSQFRKSGCTLGSGEIVSSLEGHCIAAGGLGGFVGDPARAVGVDVEHHDVGPLGREYSAVRASDPSGAAGDDGRLLPESEIRRQRIFHIRR